MENKRNKKGKSSPKGRGRVARKQRNGNPLKTGTPQVLRVPGLGFDTDSERVSMRFTDALVVTPSSAGVMPVQQYGVNTPRVPDRTGMSGVVQGWTSLIAKYESYVSFGSRIRWRVQPVSAGSGVPPAVGSLYCGVLYPLPSGATAITSNITDVRVQKYSRYHNFPHMGGPLGTGNADHLWEGNPKSEWRGRHSITVAKVDGEADLRNSSYEANVTGDPGRVPTWVFNFQDILQDSTSKQSFLFEIELDYDVFFFRRLAQVNALVGTGFPRVRKEVASAEEKKAPPQIPSAVQDIEDLDVSPLSHPLPGGYELVKRKSLAVLSARR